MKDNTYTKYFIWSRSFHAYAELSSDSNEQKIKVRIMDKSNIWFGLVIAGIVALVVGAIVGLCFLIWWFATGIFTLFAGILESSGVSVPVASTISLILVVIIVLFCCCRSSGGD